MTEKRVETAADLAKSMTELYAAALSQPAKAWSQSLAAGQEMFRSLTGSAAIEPDKGDKRFRDPVWTSTPPTGR